VSDNGVDRDGGGVWFRGGCVGVAIINSTISGNRATGFGGGVFGMPRTCARSFLNNVTIAANTADSDGDGVGDGGGIFMDILLEGDIRLVMIANSLVGGNTDAGGEAPDCGGVINSLVYNLVANPAGGRITGDTTGNLVG